VGSTGLADPYKIILIIWKPPSIT